MFWTAHGITADDCTQVRAAAVEVGMIGTLPPTDRGGNDYIARDPSTGRAVLAVDGRVVLFGDELFDCLARTRHCLH